MEGIKLFGESDCIENSRSMSYKDKVIVLNPEHLTGESKSTKYQLWIGRSGKGLDNFYFGKKLIAELVTDGEEDVLDRQMFLGILKDELIPEEIKERLGK